MNWYNTMIDFDDGVYYKMLESDYHKIKRFSVSGAKKLLISPLDFYEGFFNYEESETTDAQLLGKATHKRVLEGSTAFYQEYCAELNPKDYSHLPGSSAELKAICKTWNLKQAGTKAELVSRIRQEAPTVKLFADVQTEYDLKTQGLIKLKPEVMNDVKRTVQAIKDHDLGDTFTGGRAEVTILYTDKFGIKCKCRIDYLRPDFTVDLKSFSNSQNRNIDVCIANAVVNYGYHLQAFEYFEAVNFAIDNFPDQMKGIKKNNPFVFVFTQTGDVKNVRARAMKPSWVNGQNEFWLQAKTEIFHAKKIYQQNLEKFGVNPWISKENICEFQDNDFPIYFFDNSKLGK